MYAMQQSKVLSTLTKKNKDYSFFVIPDEAFEVDSSLILEWTDAEMTSYRFSRFDRDIGRETSVSRRDLSKMILNHVGISSPEGIADKEFIETLAGNYIVWNNLEATVQGARPNTFGYNGDSIIDITPVPLEEPADNGTTYRVNGWFSSVGTDMFTALAGYPKFRNLLEKAGLYNSKLYEYTFLTEGEFYTIFIPSDQALDAHEVDTLPANELAKLLKYHFIRGELIFTDGKKPGKAYETLREDERSTRFTTYYSTIDLRPGPDMIEILDAEGNPYFTINEAVNVTNIMVGTDTDLENESETDFITTAVIHQINEVLMDH
jgi:hypothetical protein